MNLLAYEEQHDYYHTNNTNVSEANSLLSWEQTISESFAGADIVLELRPSGRIFNVSRLIINRLPFLARLIHWLEKYGTVERDDTTANNPVIRLQRLGTDNLLKTVYSIYEEEADLFEILMCALHAPTTSRYREILKMTSERGELLPLLQFLSRYEYETMAASVRLLLANQVIDSEVSSLEDVLTIAAQFDSLRGQESRDGSFNTKVTAQHLLHPVMCALLHRLRLADVSDLQRQAGLVHLPSLILMQLIIFSGEKETQHAELPHWSKLSKKRIFADAALLRATNINQRQRQNMRPGADTNAFDWDVCLCFLVRESFGDSQRLAKRLLLFSANAAPVPRNSSPLLRRTHSLEEKRFNEQRQRPRTLSVPVDTAMDWVCTSQQQQQLLHGPLLPFRCEHIFTFARDANTTGAHVKRRMSPRMCTSLSGGAGELVFFMIAERVSIISTSVQIPSTNGWEYKLCASRAIKAATGYTLRPSLLTISLAGTLWVDTLDGNGIPSAIETAFEAKTIAYDSVVLGYLGRTVGDTCAAHVPLLMTGYVDDKVPTATSCVPYQ